MSSFCSLPTCFRRVSVFLHSCMNRTQTIRRLAGSCAYLLKFSTTSFQDSYVMAGRWSVGGFDPRYLYVNLDLFQNIHAIGDRANAIILDAFENALKDTNVTALRPRLEHAQIMRREDMTRLGKLGGESTGSIHLDKFALVNWAIQS
jgi:hypothetical protein